MFKYLFLKPKKMPKREATAYISAEEAPDFVRDWEVAPGRELHIDLETTGLDWHFSDGGEIVSMAIASSKAIYYVDVRELGAGAWEHLLNKLSSCNLFAFNMCFDGGWLYHYCFKYGSNPDKMLEALSGCTLTMFRSLANEGYFGQTHSLEVAMETLLRWQDVNKHWLKDALARHNLKKGEMWKLIDLEPAAFAKYNALDAEASFQLKALFIKNLARHGLMHRYQFHVNEEMVQIRELIEQQWVGIKIAQDKLAQYIESLKKKLVETEAAFRNHELTRDYITGWEQKAAEEFYKPHVSVKRVFAKHQDAPWERPEEWLIHPIAEGEGKKRAKWEQELGCRFYKEEIVQKPRNEGKPAPKFNMQSNAHMQGLIYGHLFNYTVNQNKRIVTMHLPDRDVDLFLTKEGGLPVGKEMYQVIGDVGNIISTYARTEKELGYAETLLAKSAKDGRVHPQFKPHGTMTGRLSASGGINLQQYPKTADCLGCFVADEGNVIIDIDFAALEPVVQTEFSRDESLRELYLAHQPHDIYLWWAQYIHPNPEVRKELQREYPIAWRNGTMEEFKKKYKNPRNLCKVPVLAFSYSMGAKKLYASWRRMGHKITFDDAVNTYETYWEKLATYKAWGDDLRNEVVARGGWMLNGFGFPMAIPEERMKDVTNTFVQSTGHAVLMVYNKHVSRLVKQRGLRSHTPMVQDFHDERIAQVATSQAAAYTQVLRDAMTLTNEELQPDVPFKGEPAQGNSIWEVKGG